MMDLAGPPPGISHEWSLKGIQVEQYQPIRAISVPERTNLSFSKYKAAESNFMYILSDNTAGEMSEIFQVD